MAIAALMVGETRFWPMEQAQSMPLPHSAIGSFDSEWRVGRQHDGEYSGATNPASDVGTCPLVNSDRVPSPSGVTETDDPLVSEMDLLFDAVERMTQ